MSKELVEYLRKPVVLQEANMGGVIDQMMGKMSEAADEIDLLNGIIDLALGCCDDVEHTQIECILLLSRAHKVKE